MRCKVILVDLDGTLCTGICWTAKDCGKAIPRQDIIDRVNRLYRENFIVIFTARRDHLIPATLKWLRMNNVQFHAFSNFKCTGDCYIDDKAVKPEDPSW
jgi:uncharacterized HAD superfamily protein